MPKKAENTQEDNAGLLPTSVEDLRGLNPKKLK